MSISKTKCRKEDIGVETLVASNFICSLSIQFSIALFFFSPSFASINHVGKKPKEQNLNRQDRRCISILNMAYYCR